MSMTLIKVEILFNLKIRPVFNPKLGFPNNVFLSWTCFRLERCKVMFILRKLSISSKSPKKDLGDPVLKITH